MNSAVKSSFLQALGVVVYVSLVGLLISNGEKIFGNMDNRTIGPIAFLLLFVLSAATVGSLVFGRSVLMYLDGKKSEAVRLLGFTIGWMFVATLIFLGLNLK